MYTIQKEKEASKEPAKTDMEAGNCPKDDHENLPPGFRFHPTDEELITCYLINKISDSSFTARAITDVDLNKCEPWELPGFYLSINCHLKTLSFYSCRSYRTMQNYLI